MFDARSILDAIVAGSSEETRGARESGGLGDIMSDILKDAPRDGGGAAAPGYQPQQPSGRGGYPGGGSSGGYDEASRGGEAADNPFGDLLRKLGGEDGGQAGGLGDILRKLGGEQSDGGAKSGQGGGFLDEILKKLGEGQQGQGGSGGRGQDAGGGGLGDILRKLGAPESEGNHGGQAGDPFGDILRKLGGGQGSGGQGSGGQGGGGFLDDILKKLGEGQAKSGNPGGGRQAQDDPLGDILRRWGGGGGDSAQPAPRYDQAPGVGGPGYGEMLERIKDLVANNKGAAGAIIGGLGGLLLGTRAGRSLAGRAVRLGGLALIGALAWKAMKGFQQGAPVDGGRGGLDIDLPQPPSGSGYEADSMTNDDAVLFIRTMVAAAAADGQIDRDEQQKILGQLEQAGMDQEAMQFLANEFNHPASVRDIVSQVRTREQATQVYTAARIAIEPDTRAEQQFLSDLSSSLDLDSRLTAHIDAAAAGIKVR